MEDVKKIVQKPMMSETSNAKGLTKAPQENRLQAIPPDALPDLASVKVTDGTVWCSFEDGRTVSFPLQWSDKLVNATTEQRQAFEFNAHFIFWDAIDEIIGVRNVLLGRQLQC